MKIDTIGDINLIPILFCLYNNLDLILIFFIKTKIKVIIILGNILFSKFRTI